VAEMVKDLLEYSLVVDFYDPHADAAEVKHEYGLEMVDAIQGEYDAVILAVAHQVFQSYDEDFFVSITRPNAIFADLKSLFRNRMTKLKYWSL
jgi:UDP-N-acetyl-D-glucosamine/UDP-N-acetyl-D-galactosamine dehydrogenase